MIGFKQASVLVVDDSPTMRSIVAGMLGQLGTTSVEQAENGKEALAKIRTSKFTVIISDWNMEPMDGLALLRAVAPMQKPRQNHFIFMTTEGSYSHRTTARLDKADDFICKPFQIQTLKGKMEKVFARC